MWYFTGNLSPLRGRDPKGCLYVHAFELPDCRILDDDIYDDAKSVDRCDRKIVKAVRKDKGAGSRFCDDDVLGAAFYPDSSRRGEPDYQCTECTRCGLWQRMRAMVSILVPLLVSATRRAYELANAMEARCYHGGEGRTKMKPLKYRAVDRISYGVLLGYLVCVIGITHFIPW